MTITFTMINTANVANQNRTLNKTTGKFMPIAQKSADQGIKPDTSLPAPPQSATVKLAPLPRSLNLQQTSELAKTARSPNQPIKVPPTQPATPAVDAEDIRPIKYAPLIEEPEEPFSEADPVPMQPTSDAPGTVRTNGKGGVIICTAPDTQ